MIIGVDTGGTFTDIIFIDNNQWKTYKLLSTPWNPSEAVLNGIKEILNNKNNLNNEIVHGSTVATNTLIERNGAITAIITNKGFEDVIEIGRQNRSKVYDLHYKRPKCLVSRENRFGIKGRINYMGVEIEPLDREEIVTIISELIDRKVESVAVCLLFSFLNPEHELFIRDKLKSSGIYFSLSHKILTEYREYERFSTTVVNSYVGPKMSKYISLLKNGLGSNNRLRIMQSNGGSISAELAAEEAVRTIFSGPAGGVVGAFEISKKAGFTKIITFDMGGTSTDVSLIDENISITTESKISGVSIKTPMIDIHTVGAGGGSIVYLDSGGSLRVGPYSAGADPGPICYGKGKKITVTDANLYLGRLIPEYFLDGKMPIYKERIKKPFYDIAKKLKLDPIELAEGIISVANSNMQKAIRAISIERGYNPKDFVLFSFGGAGGMHSAFLAKLLNIPKVIIPENPGLLSAIGMLMSDVIKDYSKTIMKAHNKIDRNGLLQLFYKIEKDAIEDMLKQGFSKKDLSIERYLDMRYENQSYEIIVPFVKDYINAFHNLHQRLYGYKKSHSNIQIVNLRIRIKGITKKPFIKEYDISHEKVMHNAILNEKKAIFFGKSYSVPIIKRKALLPGNNIKGPAIIVEYSSTIVIPPFSNAYVDRYKNIIISY